MDHEEVRLVTGDISHFGRSAQSSARNATDEDDEPQGGQRVQCAQQ
jgi:hypothetical protein